MKHKEVILSHYARYPKMEITDFLKLFYQNSFGPGHFSNPDHETVKKRLNDEQSLLKKAPKTPEVIDIGHGYARVYLPLKEKHLDVLAKSFHRSLEASPGKNEKRLGLFQAQVDDLFELIKAGEIPLSLASCKQLFEQYLKEDMPPLRHSETYREAYAPHYRVVDTNFLPAAWAITR